jgi:putative Ca2+/H+ antiporter (TMEM165/GDT1 family)
MYPEISYIPSKILFIGKAYRHIIMERINGETITGIALVFLAILFIYAGTVNSVWATIFPADFLILAIGAAFMILGMWDIRKKQRIGRVEEGENSHRY